MGTEELQQYQEKIFNKICLMQKNKNDADLDEDEIQAYQFMKKD